MIALEPTALQATPASQDRVRWTGVRSTVKTWTGRHPVLGIALVSAVAVIINCYPIIFCGRSYVSPACAVSLAYDWWPPMPQMDASETFVPQHGSDAGAMMWWDVPLGFLESRSLLEHGEIPLWDRYSHAGSPLIGQAVTMLGDPLQLIVILGRGSALAWDLKFLTAKFLFCFGFGLLILRLLKSEPLAVIYAALAAWCGAYFFIANHPLFFVLAYSPWILLSALNFLDPQTDKHVRWGILWLVANFGCFNAGFVEVAVDLIAGLNLAAMVDALWRDRQAAVQIVGRMAAGTLLFVGLCAPVWIPFLVALNGSTPAHAEIKVVQQPLESIAGAFDQSFFKGVSRSLAPGTSLLVMVGVILSALNWRQFERHTFFWANTAALVVWGGFVFGWMPAAAIKAIPLLNRVGHISADFSFLLVIHLTIQSAYGFKSLATPQPARRTVLNFLWILLILLVLLWKYTFLLNYQHRDWYYFVWAGLGAIAAPWLYTALRRLKSLTGPIPALGYLGVAVLGFIPQHRFGLYTFGDKNSLLVPGPRVALNAPSSAIEAIKARESEPFRVVSLKRTFSGALSGNYSAVYGLEDIRSCAPLVSQQYIDLITHVPGMSLTSAWIIGVNDPVLAQPLLSLLNVKYILDKPGSLAPASASANLPVAHQSDFLVLENPKAWPRAFFVNQVTSESSVQDFAKQLLQREGPFACLSQETLRNSPELRSLQSANSAQVSLATDYKLRPNSTSFRVHADGPGIVCLTEGQAKDFSVIVNHESKEVLTVNHAFKGVYVPAGGDYEIEFIYRPHHWGAARNTFSLSLVCGIALVGRSAYATRKDSRQKKI